MTQKIQMIYIYIYICSRVILITTTTANQYVWERKSGEGDLMDKFLDTQE